MPSSITEDDSHFEAVQEQMEKAQSSGGSVRSLFTSGYVRTRTSRALRKPIISIYDGIFMIHHVSRTRLHVDARSGEMQGNAEAHESAN